MMFQTIQCTIDKAFIEASTKISSGHNTMTPELIRAELQTFIQHTGLNKTVEIRPSENGLGESYFIQDQKKNWVSFAYTWAHPHFSPYLLKVLCFMGDINPMLALKYLAKSN